MIQYFFFLLKSQSCYIEQCLRKMFSSVGMPKSLFYTCKIISFTFPGHIKNILVYFNCFCICFVLREALVLQPRLNQNSSSICSMSSHSRVTDIYFHTQLQHLMQFQACFLEIFTIYETKSFSRCQGLFTFLIFKGFKCTWMTIKNFKRSQQHDNFNHPVFEDRRKGDERAKIKKIFFKCQQSYMLNWEVKFKSVHRIHTKL